jgi:two-component system sensor histidine kinase HydH
VNLLKQTSLILGLASLSIGAWTLYRNWKQKLAIWFTVLCVFISIWALSFVSHATLLGRLSKDIHWFFHVWLVPVAVTILSKILYREDWFSRNLKILSYVGAVVLSAMIAFSIGSGDVFWTVVSFWPFLVVMEFLYVMAKDLLIGVPVNVDFFSPTKRIGLYFGLAVSLITCSFDHLPEMGLTIPAIGNLLLTIYLIFVSQLVSPQKLLNVPALVSRLFTTIILSLIITGFFALLYQYMSESFPLFFLNSFLLTFAILMLWSPLLTFFRFLGKRFLKSRSQLISDQIFKFMNQLSTVTSIQELEETIRQSFEVWIPGSQVSIKLVDENQPIPEMMAEFFQKSSGMISYPVLHRGLIQKEKDQVVTQELEKKLDSILSELDAMEADLVLPVYSSATENRSVALLVIASTLISVEDLHSDFGHLSEIFKALQEVEKTLLKIGQIDTVRERDRLALLGEMSAGLAHEVRNPLGAIQGAVELIETDSGPWITVIRDEVQRLNRLVNQFLDFAHSPSDELEEVVLADILKRSIQNLSPFYSKQVEIQFHAFYSEALVVKSVPDHLQQILMNLIQNSVKAQATKIDVSVFNSGFTVSDNGRGMSSEVKMRVFKPFFTTFKNGTGLGLSICERLVKFSGGKIFLESEEGLGTKVVIELCAIKSSS